MVRYNPGYARGILTAEPTNWLEDLEKVYARQERQLKEHQANLRQRDQEEVKRSETESFVKLIEQGANFSASLLKLKKQREDKKAGKEPDNEKTAAVQYATDKDLEDAKTYFSDAKRKDFNDDKNLRGYIEIIKANGNIEFAKQLEQFVGSKSTEMLEVISGTLLRTHYSRQAHLDSFSNDGISGSLDTFLSKSSRDQNVDIINWQKGKLAPLGLSNEFWAAHITPEIRRQSKIKKNLDLAVAKDDNKLQESLTWLSGATSYGADGQGRHDYIYHERQRLTEKYTKEFADKGLDVHPDTGNTASQTATEEISQRLQTLLKAQRLTLDEAVDYLGFEIDHPAGKTNKDAFFNELQIKDLIAADKLGKGIRIAQFEVQTEAIAEDFKTKLITPGGITSEERDQYLGELTKRGYNQEKLNNLMKIDQWAQSGDVYEKTIREYTPTKIVNTDLTNIDLIPNEKARQEIRKKKEILLEYESKYGPSTKGSSDSVIMNNKLLKRKVPWAPGMNKNDIMGEIANEIDNIGEAYKAKLIWDIYGRDGNLDSVEAAQIGTLVRGFKNDLYESKGGGTSEGLYGIDETTGRPENYLRASRRIGLVGSKNSYTEENHETWMRGTVEVITERYDDKEALLKGNIPVFDEFDFRSVVQSGVPTDRMEVVYKELKRKYPDLTLSELWKRDIKIYGKGDKNEWVENLGLEKIEKFSESRRNKEKGLEDMKFALKSAYNTMAKEYGVNSHQAIEAANLVNLFEINGWAWLTTPQRNRVIQTLQTQFETNQFVTPGEIKDQETVEKWSPTPSINTDVTNLTKDYG